MIDIAPNEKDISPQNEGDTPLEYGTKTLRRKTPQQVKKTTHHRKNNTSDDKDTTIQEEDDSKQDAVLLEEDATPHEVELLISDPKLIQDCYVDHLKACGWLSRFLLYH